MCFKHYREFCSRSGRLIIDVGFDEVTAEALSRAGYDVVAQRRVVHVDGMIGWELRVIA